METPPDYLSTTAAAEYLTKRGIAVKPNTLARWRSTGRRRLRYLKIGTIVRYERAELDRLIRESTVDPGEAA